MYREAEPPHEQPAGQRRRRFAPVPLGIASGVITLLAEFFGLFLLAWGVAPTSIGCGAGRAATMTGAMLAISIGLFAIVSAVGLGIMRDAREPQVRRRSYLLTFAAVYVLGSLPLLALAPLFGSCFDF